MGQFKVGKLYTNGNEVIKILRVTSEEIMYEWTTGSKYINTMTRRSVESTFKDFKLKLEFKDYYNEIRF